MKLEKMRILIVLIVFVISGHTQNYELIPEYKVILEKSLGNDLIEQCSRSTPEDIDEFYNITNEEIEILEQNFKKIKKVKSTNCCWEGVYISNLKRYGYQYIGVIIDKKKYIYINAFLIESKNDFETYYKNWETEPINICDGGNSYWGILFDLKRLKFIQLSVNGIS
jgi:hypothetical protein